MVNIEEILKRKMSDLEIVGNEFEEWKKYPGFGRVINAMRECYNQAIDDSIEYLDNNPDFDIQAIENLKQ